MARLKTHFEAPPAGTRSPPFFSRPYAQIDRRVAGDQDDVRYLRGRDEDFISATRDLEAVTEGGFRVQRHQDDRADQSGELLMNVGSQFRVPKSFTEVPILHCEKRVD